MLPGGDETKPRLMGVLIITNDGSGTEVQGNYVGVMRAEYGDRSGTLKAFHRKTQSVWSLIGAFLKLFGHTRHSPKLMEELQPEPPQKTLF